MKEKIKALLSYQFKTVFTRYLALFSMFILIAQGLNFFAIHFTPYGTAYAWLPLLAVTFILTGIAYLFSKSISDDTNGFIKLICGGLKAAEKGEKADLIRIHRQDEFRGLVESINNVLDSDQAVKEANEDALTGLANRRYLMQRLERLLAQGVPLAVMFIDLDGFKPINDEYGHDVGDEALKIASERMGACIRESDIVSRIGGDEFVILFTGLSDEDVLRNRGDKVLEMVGTPMWIDGNRLRMGASIGISVYPKDAKDAEGLLNAADEAMYAAKQGGKNAYRFYS